MRSHALAVKERALREREESRDKSTKEMQEQVATLLTIVARNTETIASLQAGKADAEAQAETYRGRLAQVIARAIAKNQKAHAAKPTQAPALKTRPKRKAKKTERALTRRKRPKKRSKR